MWALFYWLDLKSSPSQGIVLSWLWSLVIMNTMKNLFKKILIANRGEIAVRILRACQEMGIATVAVYSEVDAEALHVTLADEAYCLGPAPADQSYLNTAKLFEVLADSQADALHPGYGFLSENADFARELSQRGITLIGPSPEAISLMGSKIASKTTMDAAGVPTVPGYYGEDQSLPKLTAEAQQIGFPLLVKASSGGGGKGMRVVHELAALESAIAGAKREAQAAFGDDAVFLERYFEQVRHIEFQILADQHGHTVHLLERDCSIQRRHQKIMEESPSPALNSDLRQAMGLAAVQAAQAVNYTNAGTVEMLLDDQNQYYFLEMNTRLQVEHPVTEMITGIDLVKAQIRIAAGEPLWFAQSDIQARGHALELRVYAEDPDQGFLPTTGKVAYLKEPTGSGVRVDSALYTGFEVTPYYDPMLAKVIVHAETREDAIAKASQALNNYVILGVQTNIGYLQRILRHPDFVQGAAQTHFVESASAELQAPKDIPAPVLAALLQARASLSTPPSVAKTADPYSPWQRVSALRLV